MVSCGEPTSGTTEPFTPGVAELVEDADDWSKVED
jgi:hypothetical protein